MKLKNHSHRCWLLWSIALGLMVFATGCGGGDDGDGGQLSASEEQLVKDWLTELGGLSQSLDQMMGDLFSGDRSQMDEILDQMRRMGRLLPPSISNSEADQTFEDYHEAISTIFNAMIELLENLPAEDEGAAGGQDPWEQVMLLLHEMEQIQDQVRTTAQAIQQIIEVDFADDEEDLVQLRQAMQSLEM